MKIDKDNIKLILILLVVALGIGYSYLNTELNINGTANINSANWNVYWNNVQVSPGSVEADIPTIDANQTTVSFNVTLTKPGDYYEFTVDAVNAGTLDAMIETINSKLNGTTISTLPTYLEYDLTYSDETPLQENQELKADTIETYIVRIGYKDNISASDLPSTEQALLFQLNITYKQADGNAQAVDHGTTVYTVNYVSSEDETTSIPTIGQAIPNDITQYSSANDAMLAFENRPFYLKHIIKNGLIDKSFVEFIISNEITNETPGMRAGTYSLRGFYPYDENASSTNNCKAEYYDSSSGLCISPYYKKNKQVLQTAFGSVNCNEYSGVDGKFYLCTSPNIYAITVADMGGISGSYASNRDYYCVVGDNDGISGCAKDQFIGNSGTMLWEQLLNEQQTNGV